MARGNREEAIELLKDSNLKLREISEKTGVPMGSLGILSKMHRSGWERPPKPERQPKPVAVRELKKRGPAPEGDIEKAKELLLTTDHPHRYISEQTGVCRSRVSAMSVQLFGRHKRPGGHQQTSQKGARGTMTDEWIKERYIDGSWTYQMMADELGVSRERVRQILKDKGYPSRIHDNTIRYWARSNPELMECEKDYFEKIDSEEKAYWLGFLTAKSRITDVNHGRLVVDFSIAPYNIEHIGKFFETIGAEYYIRENMANYKGKQYTTRSTQLKSHHLARRLQELRIESPKYEQTKLPDELPEELRRHYFRGHFDGKGFIWDGRDADYNTDRSALFMYGSLTLLEDFCWYIVDTLDVELPDRVLRKSDDHHNYHQFRLSSQEKQKRILDHLYHGATIYHPRQYGQYRSLFYDETV